MTEPSLTNLAFRLKTGRLDAQLLQFSNRS